MNKLVDIDLIKNLIVPIISGGIGGILTYIICDYIEKFQPIIKLGDMDCLDHDDLKTIVLYCCSLPAAINISDIILYTENRPDNRYDKYILLQDDKWIVDQNTCSIKLIVTENDFFDSTKVGTFSNGIIEFHYKPMSGIRRYLPKKTTRFIYHTKRNNRTEQIVTPCSMNRKLLKEIEKCIEEKILPKK